MKRLAAVLGAAAASLALVGGVGSANGEALAGLPNYVPGLERDVGVTTSTAPSAAVAGDFALLSSLVVNHGGSTALVAFTDTVPDGLAIDSATAGSGSCTTTGQTVACRILVGPAGSAPVNLVVTPAAPGSYSNEVAITATEGERDPNPGNDSAAATLTVAAAAAPVPARTCKVPALRRMQASVAKRVLGILGCGPRVAKRVHSRRVARGRVIRTTPKPGTYKRGRTVALTVSSGPAKPKRHRR